MSPFFLIPWVSSGLCPPRCGDRSPGPSPEVKGQHLSGRNYYVMSYYSLTFANLGELTPRPIPIIRVEPGERRAPRRALETLRNGMVLVYPTDTVYGVGCRIDNEAAVRRIYELISRDEARHGGVHPLHRERIGEVLHAGGEERLGPLGLRQVAAGEHARREGVQPERRREARGAVAVHPRLDPPPPRRALHEAVGSTPA